MKRGNLTLLLADYAANVAFDKLPSEVVSVLKRIVLDSLGVSLAANTLGTGIRELVALARETGGSAESTLLGFRSKAPLLMAALANGAMAHALNYDDMTEAGAHLGASTLPSALSVAERRGGVSGKEFMAALAAGAELVSRIGLAVVKTERGEMQTRAPKPLRIQLWAYFGAAASAGRVIRLDRTEMHSALGLALMQATGTSWQLVLEGKPAKIYTAFPNMAGALSALLSRQGVRADFDVFEGQAGIFASFYGGEYVRTLLEEGLGEEFFMLGARFKPWPITGVAHPFIEAALDLASRREVDVSAIERAHLRGGPRLRHHCEPIEERRNPRNGSAAGDSIFFGVAKALVNREINLASFTPEGLGQPEVLRLAERMDYSVEPELGESGIVEITLAGGSHVASRVDTPRGHSSRPLTYSEMAQKFRDCARYADRPLSESAVDRTIELIDRLEEVPDVSVIPALIGGEA